ncbi:hypothetical protein [Algibacillus agarilyticus]|uniref:hypothetical protein n=1 Tax=Algibacillus agarilyticus TaxID=2234133 RepID=UPI0018E55E33|nr:hypothetical protein [Algibacillus agarilyticus]
MLKKTVKISSNAVLKVKLKTKHLKQRIKHDLIIVKKGLAQESDETKQMLEIYKRYTRKQASKEEMKHANEQFVDLLKGMGIGVVAILPFAPITIPLIVKLGQKLGIDVLPSSFRELTNPKPEIELKPVDKPNNTGDA